MMNEKDAQSIVSMQGCGVSGTFLLNTASFSAWSVWGVADMNQNITFYLYNKCCYQSNSITEFIQTVCSSVTDRHDCTWVLTLGRGQNRSQVYLPQDPQQVMCHRPPTKQDICEGQEKTNEEPLSRPTAVITIWLKQVVPTTPDYGDSNFLSSVRATDINRFWV